MKYILILLLTLLIGCGGGGDSSSMPELYNNDISALSALSETDVDSNTSTPQIVPSVKTSQTEDNTTKTTDANDSDQHNSDQIVVEPASLPPLTCEATCTVKYPKIFTGKVVSVVDGDTIGVLVKRGTLSATYDVRLLHIDAPEKGQDFSKAAKKALSDMTFGKTVKVFYEKLDRYGRILGEVYVGDRLINKEMVRKGMAWVYRKYCYDPYYLRLEAEARNNFTGLWSQPNPIPPWEYRKDSVAAENKDFAYLFTIEIPECEVDEPKEKPKPENQTKYVCGTKRYCKQMVSCEEAYFYLQECGLQRLDGDRDGIPCEALCNK